MFCFQCAQNRTTQIVNQIVWIALCLFSIEDMNQSKFRPSRGCKLIPSDLFWVGGFGEVECLTQAKEQNLQEWTKGFSYQTLLQTDETRSSVSEGGSVFSSTWPLWASGMVGALVIWLSFSSKAHSNKPTHGWQLRGRKWMWSEIEVLLINWSPQRR